MKNMKWSHLIAVVAIVVAAGFVMYGDVQATNAALSHKATITETVSSHNTFASQYSQSTHHNSLY